MENFIKTLRKFYFAISAPTLALYAAAFFTADQRSTDPTTLYVVKTVLFLITLIAVPVSSYIYKRSFKKCYNLPEADFMKKFKSIFYMRIITLNTITYITCPLYFLTADNSYSIIFAIMTVFVLLLY